MRRLSVFLAALLLAGASGAKPPAKPPAKKPFTLLLVYTPADFECIPCELKKGILKARGVRIQDGEVYDPWGYVKAFPTCVYSDGTTDTGKLIHDKQFVNPRSVTFYKVRYR